MAASHEEKNQENYKTSAQAHGQLGLDSTLYLAYRDIPILLGKHLHQSSTLRVLDFGCGAGLSTDLIETMLKEAGHQVEMTGIDISEENIKQAKLKRSDLNFISIQPQASLDFLGQFDVIICNFVLVELKEDVMRGVLTKIQSLLNDQGFALITNCASKAYNKANKWYTFNNDFAENEPSELKDNKLKFKEDQSIKVQVFASKSSDMSFTFFDFFHSGKAYQRAYQSAGLALIETHKPLGKASDGMQWQQELKSSPYKIHIVRRQPQTEAQYTAGDSTAKSFLSR